jgi:hypothetical protein
MKCKAAIIKQKCPACDSIVNGLDTVFGVCKDCMDDMDKDCAPTW